MPPTTQQVLDALEEMQKAPIPIGYQSIAKSAATEIAKLKAERLRLDKRIHNQRKACRETWEIVEMRRNYMGSPASRAAFASLLKRHHDLLRSRAPGQST